MELKRTLKEDGYQVFNITPLKDYLSTFNVDLEDYSKSFNSQDVFRTKLGDIKQIQNLHKYDTNRFNSLNGVLAGLIGAKKFTVLNNQYFCKPSNYKMTSPHQDNAYFESDEDVFTFWIPLQDVDFMNSCLYYVPKSHKRGLLEHKPIGTNVRTRTGTKGVSLYSDVYKNSEFDYVPMKFGEVVVHDKNTMHLSSPNMSDDLRVALTCIIKVDSF